MDRHSDANYPHKAAMVDMNADAVVRSAAQVTTDLETGIASFSAVPTGFSVLDQVLDGGLSARDLTVLGGVPGAGKTAMALQWARNMASNGHQVVYACYDHDDVSLLARLLMLEIGDLTGGSDASSLQARAAVRAVARGEKTLVDAAADSLLVRAAHGRVQAYGGNLSLLSASREATGLEELAAAAEATGVDGVLVVDYLQKIPTEDAPSEAIRVDRVAAGLKEIALNFHAAVLAIVVAEQSGLNVRRLRQHHLRGASGIAYEADVVLLINEKYRAVSKLHSAYDPLRAEEFKKQVVLTVAKNRHGPADISLDFVKDFPHFRFDPDGSHVEEQLIDDLMYPE
ncbi:MAG: DnaB helicase C-terminal domain-containing protein [Actinomycetia bacterium]|nr:DnaB helicase C-terminal domain-containing protein [Actinomycetes bacterium]